MPDWNRGTSTRYVHGWWPMADAWTKINLDEVEDAAPGNGFGDRWEARVAREPLDARDTG